MSKDLTDDHTNECPVCGLDIRECGHAFDDEGETLRPEYTFGRKP